MRRAAPFASEIRSMPMRYATAGSTICLLFVLPSRCACAASDVPQERSSARQIVATLLANEDAASRLRGRYMYLSQERSDRTGGHLWTEKVVETSAGVIRMLIAEDGEPLSAERIAQERRRLADIVADPAAFARKSHAREDDEEHAREMESLVAKVFNFSDARAEDGYLRIDFAPNPEYKTQSFEERVMHGISGTLLIDPQTMRLHRLEGHLPQDVSIGFGLLAKFRAGSGFAATRDQPGVPEWKTTEYNTNFNGRILFFKSIVRNARAFHSNFVRVPYDISVAQAVAMVDR